MYLNWVRVLTVYVILGTRYKNSPPSLPSGQCMLFQYIILVCTFHLVYLTVLLCQQFFTVTLTSAKVMVGLCPVVMHWQLLN